MLSEAKHLSAALRLFAPLWVTIFTRVVTDQ